MTDNLPLGHGEPVKHFRLPNEQAPADQRPTRADRSLLLRLYASPVRTAIVRIIGYDTWDHFDALDQLVPLMQRLGVQQVVTAAEELLQSNVEQSGMTIRLADHVRALAVGILGQPPCDQAEQRIRRVPPVPRPLVPTVDMAADYRQSVASRKVALERYRKHLWIHRQVWEPAAKAALPVRPPFTPRCFDIVVHRAADEHHLIGVRRRLTKKQRGQVLRWLAVLGPQWLMARTWPIETKKGWLWEREWIA